MSEFLLDPASSWGLPQTPRIVQGASFVRYSYEHRNNTLTLMLNVCLSPGHIIADLPYGNLVILFPLIDFSGRGLGQSILSGPAEDTRVLLPLHQLVH